ncbi:hypothetical protein JW960_03425 [candidate division KSB1 bacterium]|nr:hypothetical protein [candidate division KSB1 bacterium]
MNILFITTGILLGISAIANRQKTIQAIWSAVRKLQAILLPFFLMIILVAIFRYLIPDTMITKALSVSNKWLGMMTASLVGSVALMPGFIAYPLCGILVSNGAPYMLISAFSTTLMMVGILTFPVERAYLGTKVAIIRNVLSLLVALLVALVTGFLYGELFS